MQKITAIILAAGKSSRMGDLKALLEINDKALIKYIVDTFILAGVSEIIVVTGREYEKIEAALAEYNIKFVHNKDFKTNKMFDSVKLAINEISDDCEKFFIVPCDMPFFKLSTIVKMIKQQDDIIKPNFNGKNGHPVMLSKKCIPYIKNHDGTMGLKGAIKNMPFSISKMKTLDEAILLDADTKEDYEYLTGFFENYLPSYDMCLEILEAFDTPQNIINHCVKVCEVACHLTERLNEKGLNLNLQLITAGALLHDIKRREKKHDIVGAKFVSDMNCDKLYNIILEHMRIKNFDDIDEKTIVYIADKLVIEDKSVSLKERYDAALKKSGFSFEVEEKRAEAQFVEAKILKILGD